MSPIQRILIALAACAFLCGEGSVNAADGPNSREKQAAVRQALGQHARPGEEPVLLDAARRAAALEGVELSRGTDGLATARLRVTGEAAPDVFLMENDTRCVVDLYNAVNVMTGKAPSPGADGPVKAVRTSLYALEPELVSRVVFDLGAPCRVRVRETDAGYELAFVPAKDAGDALRRDLDAAGDRLRRQGLQAKLTRARFEEAAARWNYAFTAAAEAVDGGDSLAEVLDLRRVFNQALNDRFSKQYEAALVRVDAHQARLANLEQATGDAVDADQIRAGLRDMIADIDRTDKEYLQPLAAVFTERRSGQETLEQKLAAVRAASPRAPEQEPVEVAEAPLPHAADDTGALDALAALDSELERLRAPEMLEEEIARLRAATHTEQAPETAELDLGTVTRSVELVTAAVQEQRRNAIEALAALQERYETAAQASTEPAPRPAMLARAVEVKVEAPSTGTMAIVEPFALDFTSLPMTPHAAASPEPDDAEPGETAEGAEPASEEAQPAPPAPEPAPEPAAPAAPETPEVTPEMIEGIRDFVKTLTSPPSPEVLEGVQPSETPAVKVTATTETETITPPVEEAATAAPERKPEPPAPSLPKEQLLSQRVNIDFRDMELANVVALLAQKAQINVIAGVDVRGTVTASIKDIPLMQAMEIVLRMNGFGIVEEAGIYRIVPYQEALAAQRATRIVNLENAKAEEVKMTLDAVVMGYPDSQAISVAANPSTNVIVLSGPARRVDELEMLTRDLDVAEQVIPTVTAAIKLNYAEPKDVKLVVEGMLTPNIGRAEADDRGRHIVVTDIPGVVEQARALVEQIDVPVKQVAIEAMIVDAVLRDASQTGAGWLLDAVRRRNTRGAVVGDLQDLALSTTLGNLGTDALNAGVISFGVLTNRIDFQGAIAAEVQSRNAEILANPVVVTVENQKATISIVQDFPYQEITQSTQGPPVASTEFKPIGVNLEVTPRVTHDNDIVVQVLAKQSSVSGLTETGVPIEDKREASTTLLTSDGRTIFIGGLRNVSDRIDASKLPVLGDVPLVNFLFKSTDIEKINTELLVFLTCTVVEKELPVLTLEQQLKHDKIDGVPEVPDAQRAMFRNIMKPGEMRDPAIKFRRDK